MSFNDLIKIELGQVYIAARRQDAVGEQPRQGEDRSELH